MKNIMTFLLVGSLVLSLSCEKNLTKDNNETQDKQIVEKDSVEEEKVHSADTNKSHVEEELNPQSVGMDLTVEEGDWQSDYSKLPLKVKIKGIYLKLFTISYKAFLKDSDIVPEHKKIENYTIRIYEEKKYFHVDFDPKLDPDSKVVLGGETPYGREVRYIIEKQTFKIKARNFYK